MHVIYMQFEELIMKKIIVFFLICLPLYSQPKLDFQSYVIERLKEIKIEIKKINKRVDRLEDRLDKLNDKIDSRFYMLFFAILTVFTALFIFIAQRTQPIYIEDTKPYKKSRAKVIPKKRKAAT